MLPLYELISETERMSPLELILFLFDKNVLKSTRNCKACNLSMSLKPTKDCKDGYNWRC